MDREPHDLVHDGLLGDVNRDGVGDAMEQVFDPRHAGMADENRLDRESGFEQVLDDENPLGDEEPVIRVVPRGVGVVGGFEPRVFLIEKDPDSRV